MATNLFTVQSNKYCVVIEELKNIEDAGDDFMTEEEVREETGLQNGGWIGSGTRPRRTAIVEALTDLKQHLIAENRRSMIIKDAELVEFFTTNSRWSVSEFVPGLRRVGNRLSLHEGSGKKVSISSLFSSLLYSIQYTLNKNQSCHIEFKYAAHDKVRAIELFKKLIDWENINFEHNGVNAETQLLIKEFWDNPSSLTKETT